jgi:hypothetical protein
MLFTIEALDASEGDCLILHHGTAAHPAFVLIDGGPARTYNRSLLPRLRQLRAALGLAPREPLPLGLVVLTHVDDDHIAGLLKLFEAISDARDEKQPAITRVAELWHNSFDDALGNDQIAAAVAFLEKLPLDDRDGAVAGTRQGRALRDLARRLEVRVNAPFRGLVARPDDAAIVVDHEDVRLTVLGPSRSELDAYQARWDEDLSSGKGGEVAAADRDDSPFNLASIVLLVERAGRRVLLTGDGLADHILAGLTAAGHLGERGRFHVDVFKLPHHGSCCNVTPELLRRVTADTYIISANGKHGNPDVASLDMLAEARGDAAYTVMLTFPEAAYEDVDAEREPERRAALEAIHDRLASYPGANARIVYRRRNELGVRVELGDEAAP